MRKWAHELINDNKVHAGCRFQGLSACFFLVQKNGDVTSHSHRIGVEIMGNVKKKKKIPSPLSPDFAASARRL